MPDPQQVYEALDAMRIAYQKYEHPPVFTGEDAAAHWGRIEGTQVKNLFLRNKKGNRQYLVVLEISKQADLRELVKIIGDDRFSFGSAERLMETLGVAPGSVSPFGLLHPGSHEVRVIIDQDLRSADKLIFHPNLNTASVAISVADFERFLATRPNVVRWLKM